MDGTWSELCVGSTHTYSSQSSVTTVAFDPAKELIWTGTADGRLSSYYSLTLDKRTTVPAHHSAVITIHPYHNGILSLSSHSLYFHSRGGVLRTTLRTPSVGSFKCSIVPDGSQPLVLLAAAGAEADKAAAASTASLTANGRFGFGSPAPSPRPAQSVVSSAASISSSSSSSSFPTLSKPSLVSFDIVQNASVRQLQLDSPLSCLSSDAANSYSLYACGRSDGKVELRDRRSLRCEHTLSAHTAAIAAMDVQGQMLVTCGYTAQSTTVGYGGSSYGSSRLDPLVKLFDLRRLEPLQPLMYRSGHGPAFVSFVPAAAESSLLLVSLLGHVHTAHADSALLGAVSGQCSLMDESVHVSAMDLSSSGAMLMVGDTRGLLHQWGFTRHTEDEATVPVINAYSTPLDYVAPPAPPALAMSFDSPLSAHPFPYLCSIGYTPLASDMSSHTMHTYMRPLPPLDDRSIIGLRYHDHVGYAKTAQQPEDIHVTATPNHTTRPPPNSLSTLRFFAAKGRPTSSRTPHPAFSHPEYTRVILALPRYGLQSLDLSAHNKTTFTALDSLLPNSYANALLLLLYFVPAIRSQLLSHLCVRENCLQCELGFLFHMMDEAKGGIAQPRNLLRALRHIPEAGGLGLLDEMEWKGEAGKARGADDEGERRYVLHCEWVKEEVVEEGEGRIGQRIQDCSRFVLEVLRKEGVRDVQSANRDRDNERERRRQIHQKRHRALNYQLSQLHSAIQRQGGAASVEQEDAIRELTDAMHHLIAVDTPRSRAAADEGDEGQTRQPQTRVVVDDVFGHRVLIERTCTNGGHVMRRDAVQLYEKLSYSTSTYTASSPLPALVYLGKGLSFPQLLTMALADDSTTRVWCEQCSSYQLLRSARRWVSFPQVLLLEANTKEERDNKVWKQKRDTHCTADEEREGDVHWLPLYLHVTVEPQSGVQVSRVRRSEARQLRRGGEGSENSRVYELTTVISHVSDPPDKDSPLYTNHGEHLVTHCKISRHYDKESKEDEQHEGEPGDDVHEDRRWFVFNEFSIRPSSGHEASCFTYSFKQPCVVVYSVMQPPAAASADAMPPVINPFLVGMVPFTYNASLSMRYNLHRPTFTPLQVSERLSPSMRVAIDCEFVCVQPELLSSSTPPLLLRPARLTLARVSVIRALPSSPLYSVPLIDDYICTSEPVVDYLTQYSGLVPGDLDPSTSPHYLTTLKHSYMRLRHLVDSGCTFIGHGLVNDFAMLNLSVRSAQVVDTVELYRVEGQRRLSLRFLARWVLGLDIQREVHDSVEDARTALALVVKYEEMERRGQVADMLAKLYQIGHSQGFKV